MKVANYGPDQRDETLSGLLGGVAALFFDELPLAVWFTLIDSYLYQDFLRQLLSDPDFFEDVRQRLSAPSDFRQLSAR